MAIIQDFPEEVLRVIFTYLDCKSLSQCQKVCCYWYLPAHISLLNSVEIKSTKEFAQFIKSMDCNPDPTYVNSVQSMTVSFPFNYTSDADRTNFGKLITGFPNLRQLCLKHTMSSLHLLLDSDVSNAFVNNCNKIQKVEMNVSTHLKDYYYDFIYRLRHSLTILEIKDDIDTSRYGGMENFLTGFPRLQTLVNQEGGYLDSFKKCLPIIEHSPELRSITYGPGIEEDHRDFVSDYLAPKTKYERRLMISRLSKITHITFNNTRTLSVGAARIFKRYLTGLKYFNFSTIGNPYWNIEQMEVFHENVLNLACNVQHSEITVKTRSVLIFTTCFKNIVEKVWYENDNRVYDRHLVLAIEHQRGTQIMADPLVLETESKTGKNGQLTQTLRASIMTHDAVFILSEVFRILPPFTGINTFTLKIWAKYFNLDTLNLFNTMMKCIFAKIPAVNQVVLELPSFFFIGGPEIEPVSTKTNNLILRIGNRFLSRYCLKRTISIFKPFVTCLRLFYFCGVWDDDLCEFQLILRGFPLEKLSVDLTPAKEKNPRAFIVINFYQHATNVRAFFKTDTQLSFITDITYADLEGLKCGQDYTLVHIVVDSLSKEFQCFMYLKFKGLDEPDYGDKWGTDEIKVITATGTVI